MDFNCLTQLTDILPLYLTPIGTFASLPFFPPLRVRRGAGGEVLQD